jgi:hypothetical protein
MRGPTRDYPGVMRAGIMIAGENYLWRQADRDPTLFRANRSVANHPQREA